MAAPARGGRSREAEAVLADSEKLSLQRPATLSLTFERFSPPRDDGKPHHCFLCGKGLVFPRWWATAQCGENGQLTFLETWYTQPPEETSLVIPNIPALIVCRNCKKWITATRSAGADFAAAIAAAFSEGGGA